MWSHIYVPHRSYLFKTKEGCSQNMYLQLITLVGFNELDRNNRALAL
jgi:hypothetical protein